VISCSNCKKEFIIYPYLKRNRNYCSRNCYWEATRKKLERTCLICGKKFKIKSYLVRQGYGKFCSRKCQFVAYEKKRIKIKCQNCGKEILVPVSVGERKNFCSKKCKDDYERDYVKKICKNCRKEFLLPRWEENKGKGLFCSRKCFNQFKGETSIEILVKDALKNKSVDFKQEVRIGKYYVDFLLLSRQIVIECDGDYWHAKPSSKKRDKRKDEFLELKGYFVYRFSEREIKATKGECINQIFRHLALIDRLAG
jgi:very-short-patch-repair endonuclease